MNLDITSASSSRLSCLKIERFSKPIFPEQEYSEYSATYPAPESCKSKGIDHYRLTMDDAGLLLIAMDRHETPVDPDVGAPRNFSCQNDGLFDQLHDKKNCLKIDQETHQVVSNSDDQSSDHPCAEDNDHCAWKDQKSWTFHQKWAGNDQYWCMSDVRLDGCKGVYRGNDLIPVDAKASYEKCSPKWNVKKVFKVDDSRRRTRRRSARSGTDIPSCNDCDGNFQCLTKEGCTSAASQEVCANLGGGLWCPSSSPAPPPPEKLGHCCPEPIHMVWLACCTEGSCCPNRDNVTLDCCRDQLLV